MEEDNPHWLKSGSKVLAFHGPLIYEAKVLKVHGKNKTFLEDVDGKHEPVDANSLPEGYYGINAYFVHYKGWKPKWDEWVPRERLLELNEENIKMQKNLKEMNKPQNRGKIKTAAPSNIKRKSPEHMKTSSSVHKKKKTENKGVEITIEMESDLKYILVDDWEYITKDRKIVGLPVEHTVSKILQQYYSNLVNSEASEAELDVATEVLTGLKLYFNRILSLCLLYKFERLQYYNILKEKGNDFIASDVYGVEHLLRLFVTLPGLIAQTSMDAVSVKVLAAESKKILHFIRQNLSIYLNKYVNVTPAYDSLAMS